MYINFRLHQDHRLENISLISTNSFSSFLTLCFCFNSHLSYLTEILIIHHLKHVISPIEHDNDNIYNKYYVEFSTIINIDISFIVI